MSFQMRQQLNVGQTQLVVMRQRAVDCRVQGDRHRFEMHPRTGLDVIEAELHKSLMGRPRDRVRRPKHRRGSGSPPAQWTEDPRSASS